MFQTYKLLLESLHPVNVAKCYVQYRNTTLKFGATLVWPENRRLIAVSRDLKSYSVFEYLIDKMTSIFITMYD